MLSLTDTEALGATSPNGARSLDIICYLLTIKTIHTLMPVPQTLVDKMGNRKNKDHYLNLLDPQVCLNSLQHAIMIL